MSYYDVDVYSRPVTTSSAEAQLWFDRGLIWTYGYNHEEAAECFRKALEHDPDCAMAQWGLAYAVGPNYNMPWDHFDPDGKAKALADAYDATAAALALVDKITPPERALIEALPARYPQREPIDEQSPWNDAYADAMREVYQAHPDDLEVATIFAEAILNRTPWKMWDLKTGGVADGAGTIEAREVLERAMREDPAAMDHAGILHLYVHLMEMSPFPELALRAGDKLRTLVPDAGHLIHMPTHIDVLCGHYQDVLVDNQRASVADRKFLAEAGPLNFYSGYRIHNYHFAIYGAMFLGQYAPAIAAAEELIETTPEELLRMPSPPMADFIESYIPMKQHVYIRFGKWREIIDQELPDDAELYWRHHRLDPLRQGRGARLARRGRRGREREGVVPRRQGEGSREPAAPQQHMPGSARHRRSHARRRNRVPQGQFRRRVRPSQAVRRTRRLAALRRALGLDPADPPCAWRPSSRTGPGRRGGGSLPRGSRLGRQSEPRDGAS